MAAPTVTGGMAFAGGPFNNFVYQAMAPVVARLRSAPGTVGAVTTVSGLLTKPGIGMWSARPDGIPPLVADLTGEAELATGVVDVIEDLDGYDGVASVVTYTVTYEGLDPVRTIVVADTDDGRRCVSISEDGGLARYAVENDLIGLPVRITHGSFDLTSAARSLRGRLAPAPARAGLQEASSDGDGRGPPPSGRARPTRSMTTLSKPSGSSGVRKGMTRRPTSTKNPTDFFGRFGSRLAQ